jgi:hypothetical protein
MISKLQIFSYIQDKGQRIIANKEQLHMINVAGKPGHVSGSMNLTRATCSEICIRGLEKQQK